MESPTFGVDSQLFIPSLEYVHDVSSTTGTVSVTTDTIARSTVQLELRLRRQSPLSQLLCLLLPVVLANVLAIVAFFVPSNSGQKLTLSTHSLAILCILLVYMHHAVPTSAERVPLLVVYTACSAAVVSCSIFLSVISLTIYSHSGCRLRPLPIPRGLRRLIRILAKLFVMDCCGIQMTESEGKKEKSSLDTPKTPVEFTTDHIEQYNFSPSLRSHRKQFLFDGTAGIAADSSGGTLNLGGGGAVDCGVSDLVGQTMSMVWQAPPLARIGDSVAHLEERLREDARRQDAREEWKTLSLLCDRVLLGVFFLTSAITAALVLICSS